MLPDMNCDHRFLNAFSVVHLIEVQDYNRLLPSNYAMGTWTVPGGAHRKMELQNPFCSYETFIP